MKTSLLRFTESGTIFVLALFRKKNQQHKNVKCTIQVHMEQCEKKAALFSIELQCLEMTPKL